MSRVTDGQRDGDRGFAPAGAARVCGAGASEEVVRHQPLDRDVDRHPKVQREVRADGELVWDEFPHAIEYLVYAELQKGADADALAQLQRLHGTKNLQPSFKTAFHLASTRARYALERKDWAQAAALVPGEPKVVDWNKFAWPEAIGQFARGLGSARVGQLEAATAAAAGRARVQPIARMQRLVLLGEASGQGNHLGDRCRPRLRARR